ncbi:MAG TPA: insulinase family protein [Flavisolibacter sp.]
MNLKMLRFWCLLLVALVSVDSYAQIKLDAAVPTDPNVKIGKLPNGLTYYIRKNPKPEKKVELRLVVNAGSIQEDEDQRGLAHFMEHMNFNGSKNFPKNELVSYLQKVGVQFGADLNAYTSFDETVYMLPLSTDDPAIVEKGFLVLEDWAFNNLLDKTEIDKERGVVLEESRLSKGAQERMLRQYFPRLFNGSRYADRLPIGKDSVLQHFKYATLERFYKQWYRPNLMAVVVVGDIDPAEMEKKIKAHFGSYRNPAAAKARPAITPIKPRVKPEAMVITDDENPQTVLQMINFIRPAQKIKTWAQYRQDLVNDLVNELINQRLSELTAKENPPFVYGFTGSQGFIRGYEAFVSVAVLGENDPKEALDALVAETERARKFGFLPTEIERVKASMLNNAERAFNEKDKSNSSQIVNGYVQHFLEGSPIPGVENRYKFIKQVLPGITAAEINAVAKKMPATSNAFAMLLAPSAKKDKLPTNAAFLKDMIAANRQVVTPYTEKAVAQNLMEGEMTAGKVVKEAKNEKLGTTNLALSNGVTITIKPTTFKNDQIVMDAWRWGGYQRFPLALKDNAKNAANIINEMGVKDMSPTDLEKFLSGKSVQVFPYINDHEEGVQGSSSVKDFETFLQLVNLYFTEPRKDEALFKSMVTKQKGMLQFIKASPQVFYQDTLMKVVYNNSPWVSVVPTEEEFNNLDLNKAMAIYKEIFGNADGMHFTFVGNIDVNAAKPLLEKYLGSLPAKPAEHMYKDNKVRPVQGVVEANIKKGKDAKSFITLMWTGETEYNREQNMALKALVDVLNIKIIEKLREDLGGMYSGGLNASVQKRPYVHYTITANVPTGPENVDKLTEALFALIKDAQQNGVDQKDLDKVKETWKKQYRTKIQDNDYWLDVLSQSFIDQTDPEYVLNYEERVNALTVADLQKAAQKFLNMNNYVKAVLYPESATITPGVKKTF